MKSAFLYGKFLQFQPSLAFSKSQNTPFFRKFATSRNYLLTFYCEFGLKITSIGQMFRILDNAKESPWFYASIICRVECHCNHLASGCQKPWHQGKRVRQLALVRGGLVREYYQAHVERNTDTLGAVDPDGFW